MKASVLLLASFLLQVVPAHGQDFVWAKQMGWQDFDWGFGVAVDGNGNVFTAGGFHGVADFDPGAGVFNLTSTGFSLDIFVSKLDSAGNFVWARQMGGSGDAVGLGVVLDGSGSVYTTGEFEGTADFDPGAGVFNLTSAGEPDIFVSKLDSAGNFVWARQMGGSGFDRGFGVAVEESGNVYSTGYFEGTADFDPGAGVFNLTSAGERDIFVSKLDSAGNFVWARQMGGATRDEGYNVAVERDGDVFTTGVFSETADFDPGAGAFNLTSVGGLDIFVSKLDKAGNFVWTQQTGGTSRDVSEGVAVDVSGNVYTTGYFGGTADFDPGANIFNLTSAGSSDIFVSKLDSAGNFVWAQRMGGTDTDQGLGIAVDGSGSVYTTGAFSGTGDFDAGADVFNLTSVGSWDIFASKLDSAGNFVWAQQMGGTGSDFGLDVAVDGSNVYTTGYFFSIADFDPGVDVFNLTSAGIVDIFVAKYKDQSGAADGPSISGGGIVMATLLPKVKTISPLSIISVFGQNFSTETILFPTLDSNGDLDKILGGTCLEMNGERLPIFALTPGQINAQASAAQVLGPATFTVITNCDTANPVVGEPVQAEVTPAARAATSNPESATVEAATPGFFLYPPIVEAGLIAARFNADNAAVAPAGMFLDQFGPSRPAMPGDIIVLYGTGWGETTAGLSAGQLAPGAAELLPGANPFVTFGGVVLDSADVFYVGVTPQSAGLFQLAIRVPANAQAGDNQVVLTVYGKSTPLGPVVPVVTP